MRTDRSDLTYYDFLSSAPESGKFIYTLIESLPEGIVITDKDDRVIYANHKMAKMTGYARRELIGKTSSYFLNFPNQEEKLNKILSNRALGIYETYELYIRRKSGSPFLGHTITSPYKDADGKVIGTVSIVTDITVAKKESEFQALAIGAVKSLNSVMILDKFGKIEWVNEGFTRLTGYELHDVIDTRGEILIPEDFEEYIKKLSEVIRRKKPATFEARHMDEEENIHWVVSTLTPVLDPDGDVKNVVVIDTDTSRSHKAEEQLDRANKIAQDSQLKSSQAKEGLNKAEEQISEMLKAKERFLASMSHEIRTPMNGILGLVDYLLGTELSPEQKKYLYAIKLSGDTLKGVINDILDISKIDAGKMVLDEHPFRLKEIIDTATDLFSVQAAEKHIGLVKDVPGTLPDYLLGDAIRLRQIVYNLLSNAVKFTSHGRVVFSVSVKEETENEALIDLSVRDTGCGIPEDKIGYLFKDFTQLSSETPKKYGGTGLGLAITKRLVELQGGAITVKSKVNEGTTFSVLMRFRKCTDSKEISRYKLEKEDTVAFKPLHAKVLLAEDNNVNQLLAERLLTDWKCEVDMVESGKQAIEKLLEKRYDILLLDLEMPGANGYDVANEVRTKISAPVNKIPIIAVTAHADSREAEKCLNAGMDDYILKPFNPAELNRKMFRLLSDKETGIEKSKSTHVDFDYLRTTACGDDKFMLQLIDKFLTAFKADMRRLVADYEKGRLDSILTLAHKMKSAVNLFGLKRMGNLIGEIEEKAAENNVPEALISELKSEGAEIINELNSKVEEMNRIHLNGNNSTNV